MIITWIREAQKNLWYLVPSMVLRYPDRYGFGGSTWD